MGELTKKIVIVGGGFAGINFVKNLWKNDHFHISKIYKIT